MKRHLKFIGLGVLLGLVLLFFTKALKIPEDLFFKYYWILGAGVILLAIIINIICWINFSKKLQALLKMYSEEKNPQKFIDENKKLLEKTKFRSYKAMLKLNISAGYCNLKEFIKAKETLLSFDKKDLPGINRTIYDMNLAFVYFSTEESEKALEILEKNYQKIKSLQNVEATGGTVDLLMVLKYVALEDYQEAREILEKALKTRTDENIIENLNIIKEEIKGK